MHRFMRTALTVAGSDSVGGAGIQADVKAMSVIGVHATSVITAVTAQNTCGVRDILPMPEELIKAQLEAVLKDCDVKAVKTGMLYSAEIVGTVADILEEVGRGAYHIQMYMNVDDYQHYHLCENLYDGVLTHFDALSLLVMQNQHMEMDHYQVGIPSPYMNAPVKWGLAFGISSRPLMPTSTKILFAKSPQKETPEFEKSLRLSREDIRLMKLYNMLTIL